MKKKEMKTKVHLFGMCFDWRALAGLAAVGVGIAVFAPKLALGALPLLLLAACPLSMLLMMNAVQVMNSMGERTNHLIPRRLRDTSTSNMLSRDEQLA